MTESNQDSNQDSKFNFIDLDIDQKKELLEILGYGVNEDGLVIDRENEKVHECPYTGEPVFLDEASVLPGSTLVIKTTELSLSEYFTDYIEKKLF